MKEYYLITKSKPVKKRVVLYIPEQEYRLLKSKLALKDKPVTKWFREKVREELNSSKG